jgi:hypothetical protein
VYLAVRTLSTAPTRYKTTVRIGFFGVMLALSTACTSTRYTRECRDLGVIKALDKPIDQRRAVSG